MKTIAIIGVALLMLSGAAGCGTKTTTPTGPTGPLPTRIMTLSGDLTFGNVVIGTQAKKTFTIGNTGNATLNYTGITGFAGTGVAALAASPLSGAIAPGDSIVVSLFFAPTSAGFYSTVVTVQSDLTSGQASINFSGTGVPGGATSGR